MAIEKGAKERRGKERKEGRKEARKEGRKKGRMEVFSSMICLLWQSRFKSCGKKPSNSRKMKRPKFCESLNSD